MCQSQSTIRKPNRKGSTKKPRLTVIEGAASIFRPGSVVEVNIARYQIVDAVVVNFDPVTQTLNVTAALRFPLNEIIGFAKDESAVLH